MARIAYCLGHQVCAVESSVGYHRHRKVDFHPGTAASGGLASYVCGYWLAGATNRSVGALHRNVGVTVGTSANMAGEIETDSQLSSAHAAGRSWLLRLACVDPVTHENEKGEATI